MIVSFLIMQSLSCRFKHQVKENLRRSCGLSYVFGKSRSYVTYCHILHPLHIPPHTPYSSPLPLILLFLILSSLPTPTSRISFPPLSLPYYRPLPPPPSPHCAPTSLILSYSFSYSSYSSYCPSLSPSPHLL